MSHPVRRRLRRGLFVLTLLLTVGCSRSGPPVTVDRLSDREPGDFVRFADSTWRRVLDPALDEHRLTIADAERGARLPVYVHCGEWLSVRTGDLKFLISRKSHRRMLYNTRDDPQEQVDVVAGRSAERDSLRQLARQYWWRARDEERSPAVPEHTRELDPADAERLRALGYGEGREE